MVRISELATSDGKEVSIQNLSMSSLPRRSSVVFVKVEGDTDDPDVNIEHNCIGLPEIYPTSTTSKNDKGKYS